MSHRGRKTKRARQKRRDEDEQKDVTCCPAEPSEGRGEDEKGGIKVWRGAKE